MMGSVSIDASIEGLWRAWQRFARGKRRTPAFDHFAYHLERNLRVLEFELKARTYRHGTYQTFLMRDPKQRVIAVAPIRDRVVHRLVYDALVDRFDRVFLFDVWSCREGKGLHAAIDRAEGFLASFPRCIVWRADVARFFESVDHGVLRSCLRRRVTGEQAWFVLDQIIDSSPPATGSGSRRCGIPIGNVTSQVFANIILHELDRFVVHVVRPLRYLRYGDDFLLFVSGKAEVQNARQAVTAFLCHELQLRVHPRHDVIVAARRGLHFCGYDLFPTGRRLRAGTAARWQAQLRPGNIGSYHGLVRSEHCERSLKLFHWLVLGGYGGRRCIG
jgi:RNA-directed DNA polymerase